MSDLEKATQLREKGNQFFKDHNYPVAFEYYSQSIEACPNPQSYANRAFVNFKLESYGAAVIDADSAIRIDPKYPKSYYRRGVAHFALEKYAEAVQDFKYVLELEPQSKDALTKYNACKKEITRIKFEEAIRVEHATASTTITRSTKVEETYDGVKLNDISELSLDFVKNMISRFRSQKSIPKGYVTEILIAAVAMLSKLPSLVHVKVPENGRITVCGDTHGQFYDLLNIFELNGYPSSENPYLFNGDFVDRGSWSFEVVLTLLTFKVWNPDCMHLNRGNHESRHLNHSYGFEGEVKAKMNGDIYELFQEVFNWLPLAYVLNNKVLVLHGGLFTNDGVKLKDIEKIDRFKDIPQDGLMCDLLWADPQKGKGRIPNRRGVSIAFGADVTKKFLDDNNLELLVRSHEVKAEGYEFEHENRLITIFSAPNYCDQSGNKGAYIHFGFDMKPNVKQFGCVPHPNIAPMKYANQSMFN